MASRPLARPSAKPAITLKAIGGHLIMRGCHSLIFPLQAPSDKATRRQNTWSHKLNTIDKNISPCQFSSQLLYARRLCEINRSRGQKSATLPARPHASVPLVHGIGCIPKIPEFSDLSVFHRQLQLPCNSLLRHLSGVNRRRAAKSATFLEFHRYSHDFKDDLPSTCKESCGSILVCHFIFL